MRSWHRERQRKETAHHDYYDWYKLAIYSLFIVFLCGISPLVFLPLKYESLLLGIGWCILSNTEFVVVAIDGGRMMFTCTYNIINSAWYYACARDDEWRSSLSSSMATATTTMMMIMMMVAVVVILSLLPCCSY